MDSKIVNSQIRRRIWPLLRDVGFSVFTSRTAWRHRADRTDVLNFQSFNSYNAEIIGCTTYSFSVNLGCYLMAIPPQFEPSRLKVKSGRTLPREYECHFRGRLTRTFEQPELKETDIWYIDPGEKYLGWAITDVENGIARRALPWFQKFEDAEFALKVLQNDDEKMGELWGFGRNPSPVRHYFLGYLALENGRPNVAHKHLRLALESKSFETVKARLAVDVQRTNQAMQATCEDARA